MLSTMIMDLTTETVNQPQLSVFSFVSVAMVMVSIYSIKTPNYNRSQSQVLVSTFYLEAGSLVFCPISCLVNFWGFTSLCFLSPLGSTGITDILLLLQGSWGLAIRASQQPSECFYLPHPLS